MVQLVIEINFWENQCCILKLGWGGRCSEFSWVPFSKVPKGGEWASRTLLGSFSFSADSVLLKDHLNRKQHFSLSPQPYRDHQPHPCPSFLPCLHPCSWTPLFSICSYSVQQINYFMLLSHLGTWQINFPLRSSTSFSRPLNIIYLTSQTLYRSFFSMSVQHSSGQTKAEFGFPLFRLALY